MNQNFYEFDRYLQETFQRQADPQLDEWQKDEPPTCDWPGCSRQATLHQGCNEHARLDASLGLLELSRGTQDLHPMTRAALRLCARWIKDDPSEMFSDCCAQEDWEAALKGELK